MDIDSPSDFLDPHAHDGHHHHLMLPPLSASFPLPFRVLVLIGFSILLWATNLHVLHLLGIDVGWILDFRDAPEVRQHVSNEDGEVAEMGFLNVADTDIDTGTGADTETKTDHTTVASLAMSPQGQRVDSAKLHQPIYRMFLLYSAWVGGGWLLFRGVTGGQVDSMERWRGLVAVVIIGAAGGAFLPWRGVGARERRALRR
jgi:hypothetical protein